MPVRSYSSRCKIREKKSEQNSFFKTKVFLQNKVGGQRRKLPVPLMCSEIHHISKYYQLFDIFKASKATKKEH